jgi:Cys-tRNA(Pro) deacylase
MRSCSDVHNFLLEQGVAHEIVHLPALSTTAKKAADLLGVRLREICKTLVFITEKGPIAVLVSGDLQANPRLIRTAVGCRKASLAKAADVIEITGYRPGAVPPCGLALEIPIVVDQHLLETEVVYCGGGTTSTMLKIRSADLCAAVDAQVAQVAVRAEE